MEEKHNSFEQFIKEKRLFISLMVLIFLILIPLVVFLLTKTAKEPQKEPVQTKLEKGAEKTISLPCPTVKSFCDEKQIIFKDEKPMYIGGTIPLGMPVYAVIDGKTTVRSVTIKKENEIEHLQKITLVGKDFIADYFFKNEKVKNSDVKKGNILFNISSFETIHYFGNYNFVFKLFDKRQNTIFINEIQF